MYSLLRPFLFAMDAENAHHFTFRQLQRAYCLGLLPKTDPHTAPTKLMGLDLPNPVGLAAGLDKNGAGFRLYRNRHRYPQAAGGQSQTAPVSRARAAGGSQPHGF